MNDKIENKSKPIKRPFRGCIAVISIAMAALYMPTASAAVCEHVLQSDWDSGFVGNIRITNDSDTIIDGWEVNWEYDNAIYTSGWNANVSGNNPYTASNLDWNNIIQPGESVEFGIQGDKNILNGPTPTATVTGTVCDPVVTPTPAPVEPTSTPPSPVVCGDFWADLEISGLNDGDTIDISWNAGRSGAIVGPRGNTSYRYQSFHFCGPINEHPPLEILILDDNGYDCIIIDEENMTNIIITCSETPTPVVTPSPIPVICGDIWSGLEISGLNDDDIIDISWNAGWSRQFIGSIGNTSTNQFMGFCGPINEFPAVEVLILDDNGYDCSIDNETINYPIVTCSDAP